MTKLFKAVLISFIFITASSHAYSIESGHYDVDLVIAQQFKYGS